jgi:hypothetical protein
MKGKIVMDNPTFKIVKSGTPALLQGGGSRGGSATSIQVSTPSAPKPPKPTI